MMIPIGIATHFAPPPKNRPVCGTLTPRNTTERKDVSCRRCLRWMKRHKKETTMSDLKDLAKSVTVRLDEMGIAPQNPRVAGAVPIHPPMTLGFEPPPNVMHYYLEEAKRITLQHPLFLAVTIRFEIDYHRALPRLQLLMIVSMSVPDRQISSGDYEPRPRSAFDGDDEGGFVESRYTTERVRALPFHRPSPIEVRGYYDITPLNDSLALPANHEALQDFFAKKIREQLIDSMTHEVDEMLSRDGARIRDPHAGRIHEVRVEGMIKSDEDLSSS